MDQSAAFKIRVRIQIDHKFKADQPNSTQLTVQFHTQSNSFTKREAIIVPQSPFIFKK